MALKPIFLYYPSLSTLVLMAVGGLLWSILLNRIAVRFMTDQSMWGATRCPACKQPQRWYEEIPLISWSIHHGRCAHCGERVLSFWHLTIELLSACWWIALSVTQPLLYIPALSIFGSALLITFRTDGEYFMILRLCTLGVIPIGIGASYIGGLPISWHASLIGCISGALLLYTVRRVFLLWRGYEGLGEGDIELLGMIGSFLGPFGVWITLMIASLSGTLYALVLIALRRASYTTPIPFGLFLALAGGLTTITQLYFGCYL